MKGLMCNIYRSNLGECSNRGISSMVANVILLPSEDALDVPAIFEPSEDAPAVVIRKRTVGKDFYHAIPVEALTSDRWFMMGGAFIWSCDSRFPFDYPIPLHDRVES